MSVANPVLNVGFIRGRIVGNQECAGRGGLTDETIRHSAALALCLPEQLVLSCSGFEGCGLVLQQSPPASPGRVP
jgi:hypothetical protein